MNGKSTMRPLGGLLLIGALAGLLAAGCSEMTPAPDEQDVGGMDSPTHEADSLREANERQDDEMEDHTR